MTYFSPYIISAFVLSVNGNRFGKMNETALSTLGKNRMGKAKTIAIFPVPWYNSEKTSGISKPGKDTAP